MGRHTDPDTLSFVEWLQRKGDSLGFFTESEYTLYKNEYYVDLVWKLQKEKDPLFTFEIETKDDSGVFTNTAKIFGTPSSLVTKPWRHFMIIYKSELSKGHKRSLHNVLDQHNILLFENIFNTEERRKELEKILENFTFDISEFIKNQIATKPFGETIPSILKGISLGLDSSIIKDPEVSITIRSKVPLEGGVKFTTIIETPLGEPTFLDKLREATKTHEPFSIEFPELKDLLIEGKSIFPKDVTKANLTVHAVPCFSPPKLVIPNSLISFDDIQLRLIKTEGSIDYLSTEDRNLPYIFNFTLNKENHDGTFDFHFDPSQADVIQDLHFQEFIEALNTQKTIRIVEPKENQTLLEMHTSKSLDQSSDWFDLIRKLALIQQKTNHRIPVPPKITKEDVADIHTLIRIINTGEDKVKTSKLSLKTNKRGVKELYNILKTGEKTQNLEVTQITNFKIFDEIISLGPTKYRLQNMQFDKSYWEVEKLLEALSDEELTEITLKSYTDILITMKFENWLPRIS